MKPRASGASASPTSPVLPPGRSTPEPTNRQAESPRKISLRSKKFFIEPAPWFKSAHEAVQADDDDRESVTSDYRCDDAPDSTDASGSVSLGGSGTASVSALTSVPGSAALQRSTSGSEATSLTPTAPKKSNMDLELPMLSQRQGAELSPLSVSRSSLGGFSNKAPEVDVQVSASTAGEWVTRLAALQDVAQEHAAVAGRIWTVMKETFPQANALTPAEETTMQEHILQELDTSRLLLEQHAQGLVGTDLAELRLIQAETRRANDRLARMDKLYAKELNAIRSVLEKGDAKVTPKEDYEALLFLEQDERGCALTLMEETLQALFLEKPELELRINQKEYARLQEVFKKEKMSSLERQVEKMTKELEELTSSVSKLEAENEKLAKKHAREMRRASSSSSRGLQDGSRPSGAASPVEWQRVSSGEGRAISSPAGKPKAGRPKRGVKYSRPGHEAGDDSSDREPPT